MWRIQSQGTPDQPIGLIRSGLSGVEERRLESVMCRALSDLPTLHHQRDLRSRAQEEPNLKLRHGHNASAKAKRAGHSTNDNGNAGREDPATLRLRSLASSLPSELITYILEFAASTATENTSKLHLLCLSRYYHDRLAPLIYATVALCSSATIHAFAGLVNSDTKVARHVRRLWKAAGRGACRRAAQSARCAQVRLGVSAGPTHERKPAQLCGVVSVHPSLGRCGCCGSSTRTWRLKKQTKSGRLPIWSGSSGPRPRDYGDITRDSNVLRRLLQRPSLTSTAPPAARAPAAIEGLWNELSALELNEGLAPARPSKNDKFRRLTIQTAHNRCDRFRTLLADSFPLYQSPAAAAASSAADSSTAGLPSVRYETGGLAGGLDATFEDLEREWDPVLNIPTIHPTSLSGVVLDEWDALRDLINNRRRTVQRNEHMGPGRCRGHRRRRQRAP
ncbi:hypothetical protein L1887_48806 [Cichorium endivia]|nr:hypothetical protein L1887_48806 [Cichorium endivia]